MTLNIRFPFKTQAEKRASQKETVDNKLQAVDADKMVFWDEFHTLLEQGSEQRFLNDTMTLEHLSNLVMRRLQSGAITGYQAPNSTLRPLTNALNQRLQAVPLENIFKNPSQYINLRLGPRLPLPGEICVQPHDLYFKVGDIAQAIEDAGLSTTILNPRTFFNSTGSTDLYTPAVDALEKCANVNITLTPFDFDARLQEAQNLTVQTEKAATPSAIHP